MTLDCPDAGATRAAAETAGAALREARLELERQRRMQNEGVGIERDLVAAETKVASGEAETRRLEAVSRSIGAGQAASVVVRAPIAGVITAKRALEASSRRMSHLMMPGARAASPGSRSPDRHGRCGRTPAPG